MKRPPITQFPFIRIDDGPDGYLKLPQLTTAQRNALTNVVNGYKIYNTDTGQVESYEDGGWVTEGNLFAILRNAGRLSSIYLGQNWTPATAGSGVTLFEILLQRLAVGAAVGEALLQINVYGFNPGNTYYKLDFDKEFLIAFSLTRTVDDTNNEGIGYLQVKEATTHGDLAAKGLGIKINGANALALTGESYGTARGTVSLGNLTLNTGHWIVIHHKPGQFIRWYVDGTLAGTQTTVANIPSGLTAGTPRIVHSLNAGTGTSATIFFFLLGTIVCWQEA